MTVQASDVLKIRDELRARYPKLTDAELLRGVRTEVHALLQLEKPPPYSLPTAETGKTDVDFAKAAEGAAGNPEELQRLHDEHIAYRAGRMVKMHASVPAEEHVRFHKDRPPPFIKDAHHYAQQRHQSALWNETDKLVKEALS